MGGYLWADSDSGLLSFVILTALAGAAAFAAGRAMAKGWDPRWRIIPASVALAAATQFLHYALFQEELLSPSHYLTTLVVLLVVAWLGYASMRARQMATQYSWAFARVGVTWRPR